jgi:Family of unknown function (DUF6232)
LIRRATTWVSGGAVSQDASGIDVTIQGNTMEVGNEMYHLGNISRVSTFTHLIGFHGGPLRAIWVKKWWLLGSVILIAAGSSSGTLLAIGVIALLATIARIYWMLTHKSTEYVLRLESAGVVRGVLASEDAGRIEEIVKLVSGAIRNPPVTAQHIHLPNVRKIDKTEINQYGAGSTGIQQTASET